MKLQPYVTRLNESKEFKTFSKEHKDAFVAAGFFVIDFESGKNVHQIDYYVPSKKKVAAFTLDKGIRLQMMDMLNEKAPEKLDLQTKIDLATIKGILQDEMHNRNITEDIKKIIAIIQNLDGKKIWNVTCMLSGMELLRAHVEDSTESILKMERVSMLDIIKKVSPEQFKSMQGQQTGEGAQPIQAAQPQTAPADAKALAADKIKKLQALEEQIEKQKVELQKQLNQVNKSKDVKQSKPAKTKKK